MKRISLFLFLALGLSISLTAQVIEAPVEESVEAPSTDGPQMEFTETTVDYGTIEQGSDPYRFLPGSSAEIKVRYDTNRVGPFTKRVTLTTNVGEEPIVLTIKGKVEKKPEEPAGVPTNEGGMFNSGGK